MKVLRTIANAYDPSSLAARLRRRRFELFRSLLAPLPRPLTILDVGGDERFWQMTGLLDDPGVRVHVVNRVETTARHPRVDASIGDARDLHEFADGQFDVVFSNSVIEHVGDLEDQRAMAKEIMRVGKRYFVQTPNRYFPIEPHFLFPFFQFLPLAARVWLIQNFAIGWTEKITDREQAVRRATRIRLLSPSELRALFPGAKAARERLFGLTKSITAYDGWR